VTTYVIAAKPLSKPCFGSPLLWARARPVKHPVTALRFCSGSAAYRQRQHFDDQHPSGERQCQYVACSDALVRLVDALAVETNVAGECHGLSD